jgi:hypothetical protein
MEFRTRQIIGTTAIVGLLMAGGMAGAQAKDGVEDRIDPLTGTVVVDDNGGVNEPGLDDAPAAEAEAEAEAEAAEAEAEAEAEAAEDAAEALDDAPGPEGLDDAPGAPDDGL